jgi:DNA ligase (NAD+)
MNKIKELSELVLRAQEAYYNLDPIMSDAEYDALHDELKRLNPEAQAVVRIGAAPISQSPWEKRPHEIPMGSLSKVTTVDEFEEWVKGIGDTEYFITDKFDGISLECIYDEGIFQHAVTRGDGIVGEDVTKNATYIPNIPKTITIKSRVSVRGEVILTKKAFKDHFSSKYANTRNTVAGKIRDTKEGTVAAVHFKFIAFDLIGINTESFDAMFKELKRFGFESPDFHVSGNHHKVYEEYLKRKNDREALDYDIDGCVINVNERTKFLELGNENSRPLGAVAFKFDPAMAVSKILDVKWFTGSTGRVSPVAIIDPVNVQGVVISRVSLQNKEAMLNLKLFKGARVLVSRRNDVIPYLQENLDINSQDEF